jgi:GUN4-like/Caspase domain
MAKNCALVIGIDRYNFLEPLKYARRDGLLIQEFLNNQAGFEQVFLFSDVLRTSVRVASRREAERSPDIRPKTSIANRANLLGFLQQLSEQAFMAAEDNFWVFFSGYGMTKAGCDYLMPVDGNPQDIENTGISINYLTECLGSCGTRNIIIFLDAARHQDWKNSQGIGEQTRKIARQNEIISIFACSPGEYSYEIDALQAGAFTYALLEGLSPQVQCPTVSKLNRYLSFRVPQLVSYYNNAQQTPYTIAKPVSKSDQLLKENRILFPMYANLQDIDILKINACQAEAYRDFELAEYLWLQVNLATSGLDREARTAIPRIAELRARKSQQATNYADASSVLERTWNETKNTEMLSKSISVIAEATQIEIITKEIPEIPSSISLRDIHQLTDKLGVPNSQQVTKYEKLGDLLIAGKWKEADQETLSLMLKAVDREKQGWLAVESINNFPNTDLATIDQLWVKHSNGRFGFSVQKCIWESIVSQHKIDYQTWSEFGDRLGWRANNNWLFYNDLNFSINAPLGQFPAAGTVNILTQWSGWAVGLFGCLVGWEALVAKLDKCEM